MLKHIFSITLLCNVMASITAMPPYEQERAFFKKTLAQRQQHAMSIEIYNDFIEPYIQHGEKILQVPRYLKEYGSSDLINKYFGTLFTYATLHYTVAYGTKNSREEEEAAALFKNIMPYMYEVFVNIQETYISNLDVQEELQNTIKILEDANRDYAQKLQELH